MPETAKHVKSIGTKGASAGRRLTVNDSTTMTARVPSALSATFDAVSLITGRSVGSLVRESLEQWLVQHWSPERLESELAAARRMQDDAKHQADALATVGMREALEAVGKVADS